MVFSCPFCLISVVASPFELRNWKPKPPCFVLSTLLVLELAFRRKDLWFSLVKICGRVCWVSCLESLFFFDLVSCVCCVFMSYLLPRCFVLLSSRVCESSRCSVSLGFVFRWVLFSSPLFPSSFTESPLSEFALLCFLSRLVVFCRVCVWVQFRVINLLGFAFSFYRVGAVFCVLLNSFLVSWFQLLNFCFVSFAESCSEYVMTRFTEIWMLSFLFFCFINCKFESGVLIWIYLVNHF